MLAQDRATARTPAMEYLTDRGVEPTVVSVVDGFMPVPFRVRVLPLPGRPVRFVQAFQWHPLFAYDPGHRWLREELTAAARELQKEDQSVVFT